MKNHEQTWETYVNTWKIDSIDEKQRVFAQCLDKECVYSDPLAQTHGWGELIQYMLSFDKQIPGGYFETTSFKSHRDESVATWLLKSADGQTLGDGMSYGKYNDEGKLVAVKGFYDTPE